MLKNTLSWLLWPLARITRTLGARLMALWSFARLSESLGYPLHPSSVVLGTVAVEGTAHIRIGRNARIYPGVVLETQGAGRIVIGDNVVLSRGVHIVAFDAVTLGDDCMVGEYASLRDADHRRSRVSMRDSGHDCAAIVLGSNVWIGRGACVLKGSDSPYPTQDAFQACLAWKPDVVIIVLGTNDSKEPNWKHKATFVADYKNLIAKFRAVKKDMKIYVGLPTPAFGSGYGIRERVTAGEIIPLLLQIAKDEKAEVIDLHTALKDSKGAFGDGIHPSPHGAGLIAQAVQKVLAPAER